MIRVCALLALCLAACGGRRIIADDDGAMSDVGRLDTGIVDAAFPDTPIADGGVFDTRIQDTGGSDAGRTDTGGTDTGGFDTGGFDTGGSDTGGTDSGVVDSGMVDSGGVAVPRGTYLYTRLAIGGLSEAITVKFHPDGAYAVILERTGSVHIYDWSSETATEIDLDPPGSARIAWEDFAFDASGDFGILVGTLTDGTADTGVVYELDDAQWRAGAPASTFSEWMDARRPGAFFTAVEYPNGAGLPMVLSRTESFPYNAALRRFDPATGNFTSFITATPTSAGCDDLAFVDNEFGGEGVAVVCGTGGADAPYWTEIGGVGEWRPGPPATLGNASRIDAHPSGTYALGVAWSGRRVHRFMAGAWGATSGAPRFATQGIWGVTFQQEGQRALIVGQGGGSPLRAPVIEYRHELYSTAEMTDVSIPGFDAAPYLGDSSTRLNDAAFRPGCDGGLMVGGKTNFMGSTGMWIEFQIEGARDCDTPIIE